VRIIAKGSSGGIARHRAPSFSKPRENFMKKAILVGFAILAVSTSGALAKKMSKPKAPAAAAGATAAPMAPMGPMMMGQVSAQDREMYERSQRESGMKKK
jgi:hypothetical protein